MKGKHKQHTAAFKAQVALAALQGDKTVNQLASRFGVHPTLIHTWKRQLLADAELVFTNNSKTATTDTEAEKAELFEHIGRLKMELEWLKKKLDLSPEQLRLLVETDHPQLSVRRQCQLLELARSSRYYQPAQETAANLRLMRLLDQQYTTHPFLGSRRLTKWLIEQGEAVNLAARLNVLVIFPETKWLIEQSEAVNRKQLQLLMRLMGLEAIYPKPKLSAARAGHRIDPYLLRDVKIERPDQAWSTDITYVPLTHGFMYLAAIIDWFSRYVIAWRLSNTLDGSFCLEMLEEALSQGSPRGVQHRPKGTVHGAGVDRTTGVGGGAGEHGWQGSLPGQRVCGATVADGQV